MKMILASTLQLVSSFVPVEECNDAEDADEVYEEEGHSELQLPRDMYIKLVHSLLRKLDRTAEEVCVNDDLFERMDRSLYSSSKKRLVERFAPALLECVEYLLKGGEYFDTSEEVLGDYLYFDGRDRLEVFRAEILSMLKKPYVSLDADSVMEQRKRADENERLELIKRRKSEQDRIKKNANTLPRDFLARIAEKNPVLFEKLMYSIMRIEPHTFKDEPVSPEEWGDAFWYIKKSLEQLVADYPELEYLEAVKEQAEQALRYWRDGVYGEE